MSGSTSYTVNASINIRGNAQAALARLGRALSALDAKIQVTERNLQGLSRAFASSAHSMALFARAGAASSLSMTAFRNSSAQASQAAQGATRTLNTQTNAMMRNANAATVMAVSAQRAAQAMTQLGRVPPMQRPPRQGGGGGGGGGGGRRTTHGQLEEGIGAAVVGRGMLGTAGRVMRDAGALQHEETLLRNQTGRMAPDQGMTADEFRSRLMERAIETTRLVPMTTVAGNLAAGAELRTVLGGPRSAVEFLPQIMQIVTATAAAAAKEGRTIDTDKMAGQLGRALSLRGSFNDPVTGNVDPARGAREMELAGRMLFAFRGRGVNAHELEMFQRRARGAGERMGPEAYFGGWTASLIQNLGGNVAGTSLQAFNRQFGRGIMTKENAALLQRYGLIAPNAKAARIPEPEIRRMLETGEIDEDEAQRMRSGATARFNRRDVTNSDLAVLRPDMFFQWLRNHLMTGGGIDPNTGKPRFTPLRTQDELDAAGVGFGGTATSQQLMTFGLNPQASAQDIKAVQSVAEGALAAFLREDALVAMNNLGAALTNFTSQVGSSSANDAIAVMGRLAGALNDLGDWARANPDLTRALVVLTVALGGLVTAAAAFAAGSLAVGAIGSLVAGLGGLAAALFTPVGWGIILATIAGGLIHLAASMEGKDWAALFARITNGIQSAWDGLLNRLGLRGATGGPLTQGGTMPGMGPDGMPDGSVIQIPPAAPSSPWSAPTFSDPSGSGFQLNSFTPLPGGGREVTVQTAVNLDGRTIADVVSRHQGRALNAPQAGPSFNDRRRGGVAADVVTA